MRAVACTLSLLLLLAADQRLFGGVHVVPIRRGFIWQGLLRTPSMPASAPDVLMSVPISVNTRSGGNDAASIDESKMVVQPGAAALRLHFTQIGTEMNAQCMAGVSDTAAPRPT
jgi:hypothetical protein